MKVVFKLPEIRGRGRAVVTRALPPEPPPPPAADAEAAPDTERTPTDATLTDASR